MKIGDSSSYSMSASTNKGISGLASGLDTENWVEQMLSGTQKKIDTQKGLQWQTEQKQTIYRDIISSINSFKSKYFDTSYDSQLTNNLTKSSFFDSMLSSVTSGSEYVKVISTSSSAAVGDMKVAVNQLATNSSVVTEAGKRVSNDTVSGIKITNDVLENFEKTVEFRVMQGGTPKNVKVNLAGVSTQDEMLSRLNEAFRNTLGDDSVTVKVFDNRLRLVTKDTDTSVAVFKGSKLGLSMTGLSTSNESQSTNEDGEKINMLKGGGQVNTSSNLSLNIVLNGVSKQITLNPSVTKNPDGTYEKLTLDDLAAEFAKQVQLAYGGTANANGNVTGGYIGLTTNKTTGSDGKTDSLSFTLNTSSDSQFSITGIDADKLGLTPGASSKVNGNTLLKDLSNIQGKEYKFTINGKQFSFNSDDTISKVINKVNSSGAGVRLTYSSVSDNFQMESTSTGANYSITMSQDEGNLLSEMFGDSVISAGSSVGGRQLVSGEIQGKTDEDVPTYMSSVRFSVIINGTAQTFSIPAKKNYVYHKDDIINGLNTWFQQFGDIKYDKTTGKLNIGDSSVVEFKQTTVDLNDSEAVKEEKKTDLALLLGFNSENRTNVAASISQISSSEKGILQGLGIMDSSGNLVSGFSQENGRLIVNSQSAYDTVAANAASDPDKVKQLNAIFSSNPPSLGTGAANAASIQQGKNAIVVVNGTTLTRSSNQFAIDGITMQLTKESAGVASTISTDRDAEKIVDGLKSFVKDYNEMLDKLNGYVDAEASYRKYPPLTDAQKKEMSDKEIEQWEEKAKTGLIRGDSDVESFLSGMRGLLYTKPSTSNYALYDVGIETGSWDSKGKLELDEVALRNALATDPDSIKALFTDSVNGLSTKMISTINSAANLSSGSKGSLVSLAGMKGMATEKNNTLSWKIESIKDKIKDLTAKYEKERQRYWNQFNSMENALSNFNSQSTYLTQQFGG